MIMPLGYSFYIRDLFRWWNNKKLKLTCNEYLKNHSNKHRERLVLKVFIASVKMVINDILENNDSFSMNIMGNVFELRMDAITGEEFKKARRNGAFAKVDFLKSNFTGYRIFLFIHKKNITIKRSVYLAGEALRRLIKYTNQGKVY